MSESLPQFKRGERVTTLNSTTMQEQGIAQEKGVITKIDAELEGGYQRLEVKFDNGEVYYLYNHSLNHLPEGH